jgi:hypothetical protein
MADAQLLTHSSPRALLSCVVEEICGRDPAEEWCIVSARSHLRQDIHRLLLERCPEGAWIGFRTLALDDLLAHFARDLDPRNALTPLQVSLAYSPQTRWVSHRKKKPIPYCAGVVRAGDRTAGSSGSRRSRDCRVAPDSVASR